MAKNISENFYLAINDPPFLFMEFLKAENLVYDLQCEPGDGVIRTIRGHKCITASDLHNAVAAALQFPGYYGENWDAMDECLGDLAWLPGSWYLLYLCRSEVVLPNDEEHFRIFMSVLLDASRKWTNPKYKGISRNKPTRPFNILVSGDETETSRVKSTIEMLLRTET